MKENLKSNVILSQSAQRAGQALHGYNVLSSLPERNQATIPKN